MAFKGKTTQKGFVGLVTVLVISVVSLAIAVSIIGL